MGVADRTSIVCVHIFIDCTAAEDLMIMITYCKTIIETRLFPTLWIHLLNRSTVKVVHGVWGNPRVFSWTISCKDEGSRSQWHKETECGCQSVQYIARFSFKSSECKLHNHLSKRTRPLQRLNMQWSPIAKWETIVLWTTKYSSSLIVWRLNTKVDQTLIIFSGNRPYNMHANKFWSSHANIYT